MNYKFDFKLVPLLMFALPALGLWLHYRVWYVGVMQGHCDVVVCAGFYFNNSIALSLSGNEANMQPTV